MASQPDVAAVVKQAAARFRGAGLYFGHGTATARDEAAALVFHVLGLDHAEGAGAYRRPVEPDALARISELVTRRIRERRPLPYLLGEAWFAGMPFYVDERVLVPRSPFAELIQARFAPWVDATRVRRILDIGTGSGCIAIACARAFPGAEVHATDISAAALAVARRNVRRHAVEVQLHEADLYGDLAGHFDLVVSNPPYVPQGDLASFPAEYQHEPRIALAAGDDGMETPCRILQHAGRYLGPGGWLAIEVGEGAARLEARFPAVPLIWPALRNGGDGIALARAADLAQ